MADATQPLHSAIEQSLRDALGKKFKDKKSELRADYIKRIVETVSDLLSDAKYDMLPDAAKVWYEAALAAIDDSNPIQEFPDADKAEVERRFGNPVGEVRKLAKRAEKTPDQAGSADAESDAPDPAPEAATSAKRKAQSDAKTDKDKVEKKAKEKKQELKAKPAPPKSLRKPRKDSIAASVAYILARNSGVTRGEVAETLARNGVKFGNGTLTTAMHFVTTSLRVAQENDWTPPSKKRKV